MKYINVVITAVIISYYVYQYNIGKTPTWEYVFIGWVCLLGTEIIAIFKE